MTDHITVTFAIRAEPYAGPRLCMSCLQPASTLVNFAHQNGRDMGLIVILCPACVERLADELKRVPSKH